MTGPRLAQLMDFIVGSSLGELKGMYGSDVTPQQKAGFDAAVKQLREDLRNDKVSLQNLQPFLKLMQTAILDKKVTGEEVDRLTKAAHDATVNGKKKTPPVDSAAPRNHEPLAH